MSVNKIAVPLPNNSKRKRILMNTKITIPALVWLTLIACKSNNNEEITVDADAAANTEIAEAQRDKSAEPKELLRQVTPSQRQVQAPQTTVMLNPPHGQPGHRCDIAVGAPLPNDSNVIAQASSQARPVGQGEAMPAVSDGTQVQYVQVAQSQPTYVGKKGEKLNPPHGQPGHRCDIPVGAPLSSKPVAQAASQGAQPTVTQQQVVIPPDPNGRKVGVTEEGFSGKPNPPHGQPGHRCDIAVGETLP